MDKKQYDAIRKIMDNAELADEMEEVHPGIKAQMAGYLMNPWLPIGVTRKVLMIVIAFAAIALSVASGNSFYYLLLLLSLSFSPRLTGEFLLLLDKIRPK